LFLPNDSKKQITSTPFGDANFREICGGNSVVECDLAKVDVVGSNPIRRSTFCCTKKHSF
jgi:hypothetical protein